MGWIRESARNVGNVLRDYRNYIHPEKELAHKDDINADDARMFWTIFVSLTDQILQSGNA